MKINISDILVKIKQGEEFTRIDLFKKLYPNEKFTENARITIQRITNSLEKKGYIERKPKTKPNVFRYADGYPFDGINMYSEKKIKEFKFFYDKCMIEDYIITEKDKKIFIDLESFFLSNSIHQNNSMFWRDIRKFLWELSNKFNQ
jgi:hypothetical protein